MTAWIFCGRFDHTHDTFLDRATRACAFIEQKSGWPRPQLVGYLGMRIFGPQVDHRSIGRHVRARHSQEPTAHSGPRRKQGNKFQPPVAHRRLGAYFSNVPAYFLGCQQLSVLCSTSPLTDHHVGADHHQKNHVSSASILIYCNSPKGCRICPFETSPLSICGLVPGTSNESGRSLVVGRIPRRIRGRFLGRVDGCQLH